jgi:hypothetical protein
VADHPERWRSPFTQVEMRKMWTYSDGALTTKGYWWPNGSARVGNWVLVDPATGNVTGVVAAGEFDTAITRNPRQEVQHAHLHAFYAEHGETENHESSALKGYPVMAEGHRAFSAALGSDSVRVERDSTGLAADVRAAAQPWGGSYCSYQLSVNGSFWVMPALGPSQDEFNRRLARADGLEAEPDPNLGGAINLVRPTLADAGRLDAAQRATAEKRASFETFVARRELSARSLALGLAPGTPPAPGGH